MSSFLKGKKRQSESASRANTKKHIKHMYKILHELDEVAKKMIASGIMITDDNVEKEAAKYTTRTIGGYEKFILLGKTYQVYKELLGKEEVEEL